MVLEKLMVTQLVKTSHAFNGARRCSTEFTRASHWSLSGPNI